MDRGEGQHPLDRDQALQLAVPTKPIEDIIRQMFVAPGTLDQEVMEVFYKTGLRSRPQPLQATSASRNDTSTADLCRTPNDKIATNQSHPSTPFRTPRADATPDSFSTPPEVDEHSNVFSALRNAGDDNQ